MSQTSDMDPDYIPNRIVIALGPPRGGKSTFCNNLGGEPFQTLSFAQPLYDMLGSVIGPKRVEYLRDTNEKNIPLPELGGKSLRHALQTLGTEWGRELISEDVWVNCLLRKSNFFSRIAIDDLRFPNEYERMLKLGAVFVRMEPPLSALEQTDHISEAFQEEFKAHHIVQWKERHEIIHAAQQFDPTPFVGMEPTL